jgi:hypothetical protein
MYRYSFRYLLEKFLFISRVDVSGANAAPNVQQSASMTVAVVAQSRRAWFVTQRPGGGRHFFANAQNG